MLYQSMMIDIKTKIRTYGDKVYSNVQDLYLQEDDTECEPLIFIFIDSLLVYENKCYLQVYLDNCVYKVIDNSMIHYLGENSFKTDED